MIGWSKKWKLSKLIVFLRFLYTVASRIISEGIDGDDGIESYTHFAVNKANGKIVNGLDYSDYDPSELRQLKNDYFFNDLKDYGLNPKEYTILTKNRLMRDGIDPLD